MRPTFLGFETAKSAIYTSQKTLDVTGNNLANVNTNGYTRQRVDTAAIASTAGRSRVNSGRVAMAGQGVEALGVSQMRDSLLDKRFRDEYTKTSYHSQAAAILDDLQSALGDGSDITDQSGLYGAFAQIYTTINDYAQEPTLDAQANLVMSAFKNMGQVLNQLARKLDGVYEQQTFDMNVDVDRVNDIAAQIAALNRQIAGDATVQLDPNNQHYRPNELLDKRNLLLDELAGFGDIRVREQADGAIQVDLAGHALVAGQNYSTMGMKINDDKTVSLTWRDTGENVQLSGGALLADIEYINGWGANMQGGAATVQQGIPYYRDRLDTLAGSLVQVVNHIIPQRDAATGQPQVDANGNTLYKTLLGGRMPDGSIRANGPITAENICLSEEWTQGGAGYFIYNKEANEPGYAQQIATALTGSDCKFQSYGESFTGSFEEYVTDYLTKLGADLDFQEGRAKSTAKVADDFLVRRDEISGVSRDEETANMLTYQKSYEAAARLLTTLDEILDVLINRTGRVGL